MVVVIVGRLCDLICLASAHTGHQNICSVPYYMIRSITHEHFTQLISMLESTTPPKGKRGMCVKGTWLGLRLVTQAYHDVEEVGTIVRQRKSIPQDQLFIGLVAVVAVQRTALQQIII